MSEIEKEVVDNYLEHELHIANDPNCSTCEGVLDFSEARDINRENDEAVEAYEPRNPLE